MLKIFYRYCPLDKPQVRPNWFSKQLCLTSFVQSLLIYIKNNPKEKIYFWLGIDQIDHTSKKDISSISSIQDCLNINLDIEYLNTNSNTKSYLHILEKIRNEDNQVFLVEDDYLWLPETITEMTTALDLIESAHYITPYDHPVRYDDNYAGGVDMKHWENKIFLGNHRHYRPHESTCMTFLTRESTLYEDMAIHIDNANPKDKCPNDRRLFRQLQKLEDCKFSHKKRLLLGPMPSLATHVHLPFLAPIINWEKLANDIK